MATVLSNEIESHFKALGVDSVVAYKLWCYRHGLDTGLDKTPTNFVRRFAEVSQ